MAIIFEIMFAADKAACPFVTSKQATTKRLGGFRKQDFSLFRLRRESYVPFFALIAERCGDEDGKLILL